MSEFVAGAFVDVRPDAKGFREALKTQVNASIKSAGVFKVPIQFEIKAFKKQLQDAARAAKPTIPIQVGGNVAQIRKDLNDKIRTATEGMKIKVPVEFVQTGAGSRGGTGERAGGAGRGGTGDAAQKRKALTEAEKQALIITKALDAAEIKSIATQNSLASATEQNLSAEERAQRLREARTTANAAVRLTTDALAKAEGGLSDKQRLALETAQREALNTRALVLEKQKDAKVAAQQATAMSKVEQAREDVAEAMVPEIAGIKTLNELHLVENKLLAAEAALKRSTSKARAAGLDEIARENELRLQTIGLQKDAIVNQRAELKGEGKRQTQQKTGLRGGASTILSMLGLRGATLAATGAFLGGAAAAAVFTKSLKSFADFEAELNTFQAIAGATAEQMEHVSEQAKILGEDITLPAVSASDAAVAMTELARAGLSVEDSMVGARGVLELATAAQIDNAEAATLVASGLNAFSLSGEDAVHVADLLANAANAAQGSISEMGAAMQQAAAIAHQVGISLDDTVAILTLFARNGLRGSDAGTSLRTALARLIAPTKKAADLIDLLGLNVRDAQGNIRPEVFADFGKATADLPPALRDMAAEIIAGQDSIRAFAIGAREGARGLKLAQLQMAQTGTAAQVAAARTKGLSGEFSALASTSETLGIQLGALASGPVTLVTSALNDLLLVVTELFSGDFSGAGTEFLGFVEGRGKVVAREATGILHVLEGIAQWEPGNISKGLKELVTAPPDEKTRVETLLEQLDQLQKLRITAFQAGPAVDIKPITQEIQQVRAELKAAKIDAGLLIPVTPGEKALAPFREAIRAAEELKRTLVAEPGEADPGQLAGIEAIIESAKKSMKVKIKELKKDMGKELATGEDLAKGFRHTFQLIAKEPKLATPEVLAGIDDMIRRIKNVGVGTGPPELGRKIAKSLQIAIDQAIADDDPELAALLKAKADKIAALFGGFAVEAFKNINIPITAEDIAAGLLPERIASARAEAFGTVADQIAAKEAELAELNRGLGKVRKGSDDEEQILNDIIAKQNEIDSLRGEAVTAADTRVADAITAKEQALLNKLAVAEVTETLRDDIRVERELRAFYIKQIEIVKATVKDKEQRNDLVTDLTQKLFDLDLDLAADLSGLRGQGRETRLQLLDEAAERAEESETLQDDLNIANRKVAFWNKQVKILKDLVRKRKATADELKAAQDELDDAEDEAREALRSRRAQRREQRQERLDLKIQIAQDNGNVKAEIAAREAQIRNTKALIRQTRRGSLQRLRLIAELRREQRELRDLKKEKEESTKEAQAVIFAFLQAQQGFAANLLSNLVPFHIAADALGEAGAGVPGVFGGGGTPTGPPSTISGIDPLTGRPLRESGGPPFGPRDALAREATAQAAAKPPQGFTNTQATRLLALTAQMVSLMGGRVNRDSHPNSQTQRKASGSAADNVGGV